MKQYKYAIVSGSFNPFHIVHKELIHSAFELAEKVIICIEDHKIAASPSSPFSTEERIKMISSAFSKDILIDIKFIPLINHPYSDHKFMNQVTELLAQYNNNYTCLLGHKSSAAKYLRVLHQINLIEYKSSDSVSSNKIKELYFTYDKYNRYLDERTFIYMEEFKHSSKFKWLKDSWDEVRSHYEAWRGAPSNPVFMVANAVVVDERNCILLTKRQSKYGKGLYTLPGGYVNGGEKSFDVVNRSVRNLTGISFIEQDISTEKTFDDPKRSLKGRVFAHTFCIKDGFTGKTTELSNNAFWMPLNELTKQRDQFFEDNFEIIDSMISF